MSVDAARQLGNGFQAFEGPWVMLFSPSRILLAPFNRRRKRNQRKRARRLPRKPIAALQQLEERVMLSAVSWTGGGDGKNWSDPHNWSSGAVPSASDDVTISLANSQTIVYSSAAGTSTINSLNGNDPFAISEI